MMSNAHSTQQTIKNVRTVGIVYPFPAWISRGNFGAFVVCFAFDFSGGVEVTLNAAFIVFLAGMARSRAACPYSGHQLSERSGCGKFLEAIGITRKGEHISKHMSDILVVVIFIISLFVSYKLVNGAYRLYMKLTGADVMFFNGVTKIFLIVCIAAAIASFILKLFGIWN